MAEQFNRNRVAITRHIGNIFKEVELYQASVCKDFFHTAAAGINDRFFHSKGVNKER